MDLELAEDLEEALEGVDPVEFLLADPDLKGVAEEIWGLVNHEDDSDRFEDVTATELAVDNICEQNEPQCHPDESSSGISSETAASPESSSGSPWSDASSPALPAETSSVAKRQPVGSRNASCVACDQPARGFKYHGAVVCNSCRAFFARSIKGSAYKDFMCAKGDNMCKLNSKSWVTCQKCRFERCLEVGMKLPGRKHPIVAHVCTTDTKGHVNPGQEKAGAIKRNDKSCVCGGYGEAFVEKAKRLLEPTHTWTVDEKHTMEELISSQGKQGSVNFSNLIRSNLDLFEASMRFFFEGKSYPLKMQKMTENYLLYLAKDNPEAFQGFNTNRLKSKDASRLVLGNFPIISEYVNAYNMNKKKGYKEEVQGYIKGLIAQCEGDTEFKDAIQGIVSKV